MKKVGIITFYNGNYNFGGLLQAYALPFAIKKNFGLDAEQIDYVYFGKHKNAKENKSTKIDSITQMIYKIAILFFNKLEYRNLSIRRKAFDQFINEIPHSKHTYDCNSISECEEIYRVCICGGDQIWNDYTVASWIDPKDSKTYMLQFVSPKTKKISYAPSMAVLTISDEFKKVMRECLLKLDAISVREKRSVPILKQIIDKPITVVVDPVLLLTQDEWNNLLKCQRKKRKYILCYLLGDSIEQRKAVKKLSKQLHLPIVTFPHITHNVVRKCDLFFGDIKNYESGPREFLELIKNAEIVITDSFHACVFSMIFQIPFKVFERNKVNEKDNMNSRIYDFLEEYHLENQLINEEQMIKMNRIYQVDFSYAHRRWKERRKESLEYLKNALEI